MLNEYLLKYANKYDFRDKKISIALFRDIVLNKTITMFKYQNLPDSLPEIELELILQCAGHGIITEFEGNVVALTGNFATPLDIYYRSKKYIVVQPWVNINKEYKIDEDCVLMRNDPLCVGLLPMILKYGTFLSEAELTMFISLINMRALFGITADNDASYESGKDFLAQMEKGNLGVLMGKMTKDSINTLPYANGGGSGYITQIIEALQYLKGSFYQEIGLDSNYNMKRERLSESESGLNQDVLRPFVDSMLEERQTFLNKVNDMYGTNITVDFDSTWKKYSDNLYNENEDIENDYTNKEEELAQELPSTETINSDENNINDEENKNEQEEINAEEEDKIEKESSEQDEIVKIEININTDSEDKDDEEIINTENESTKEENEHKLEEEKQNEN